MTWRAEADEIHRRRSLADACGGAEAVAKQHAAGKLTVRERITRLLDPGSFREVGQLAGKAMYDASRSVDAVRAGVRTSWASETSTGVRSP